MDNSKENQILSNQTKKSTNSSHSYIGVVRRQKKLKKMKIEGKLGVIKRRIKNYLNKTKSSDQNIISNRIEQKNFSKTKKENNDPNTSNFITISPFMSKVIPFAVILVFFVSSFVFVKLEIQKREIKSGSLQVVKEININAQEKIISLSNFLDTIKNESTKFVSSVILRRYDEESRDYTNKAVTQSDMKLNSRSFILLHSIQNDIKQKVISLSNSLDTILNYGKDFVIAVSNYGKTSVISLSDSLGTIKNESQKFSSNKIISLSNSLFAIKNKSVRLVNHEIIAISGVLSDIRIKAVYSLKKSNNKKLNPRVAGVEDFEYGNIISDEENNLIVEEKGMVVIPLEGDINSQENIEMINRISSSFSDDVSVSPSEDGESGIIASENNPEDNYLYLMVPVNKK